MALKDQNLFCKKSEFEQRPVQWPVRNGQKDGGEDGRLPFGEPPGRLSHKRRPLFQVDKPGTPLHAGHAKHIPPPKLKRSPKTQVRHVGTPNVLVTSFPLHASGQDSGDQWRSPQGRGKKKKKEESCNHLRTQHNVIGKRTSGSHRHLRRASPPPPAAPSAPPSPLGEGPQPARPRSMQDELMPLEVRSRGIQSANVFCVFLFVCFS